MFRFSFREPQIGTEDLHCLVIWPIPNYSRAAGKVGRFLLTYD